MPKIVRYVPNGSRKCASSTSSPGQVEADLYSFCEWKSISVSNVYQNNMNEEKETHEVMKPDSTFDNKIYNTHA